MANKTTDLHSLTNPFVWKGRVDQELGTDAERLKRWHQHIQPLSNLRPQQEGKEKGIVLLGFACDAGVLRNEGRVGACFGPNHIRQYLANLPVHHSLPLWDAANVVCHENDVDLDPVVIPAQSHAHLEDAQQAYANKLTDLLQTGLFPIGLGGGHEIAWASYLGLRQHAEKTTQPFPRIGVINLDAHFDLRVAPHATSGNPFKQIADDCQEKNHSFNYLCLGVSEFANTTALFERAKQLGTQYRLDKDMSVWHLPDIKTQVSHFMNQVDWVYLTICLDVLPASVAPGVSAPAAYGVSLEVIEAIVQLVANSPKLKLMDIAECNPLLDRDGQTARVAARLAATLTNCL